MYSDVSVQSRRSLNLTRASEQVNTDGDRLNLTVCLTGSVVLSVLGRY